MKIYRGYGYNKPARRTMRVHRWTRRDKNGHKHLKKMVRAKSH